MTDEEMREAVKHEEPLWGYFAASLNGILDLGADKRMALDAMLSVCIAAKEQEDGPRAAAQHLYMMALSTFAAAEQQDTVAKH